MQVKYPKMTWREVGLQALLLLLLLVCVFPTTFFRGEMIAPGEIMYEIPPWMYYGPDEIERTARLCLDALTAMNAFYVLAERSIEQGEWPLWNSMEMAGMPLLANCQSTVFYPPRLVHTFLETFLALTVYILLKLWLCGMTAYLCGRGIGLKKPTARLFSVAWMLSGYNVLWCYWPLPDVAAWLPLLFLGIEWLLDGRYRRGFWMGALGAVLLLLAGHPETAFTMSLSVGVYFFLRLILERRRGRGLWMPIACAAGFWAVALLACAGQLLPFIEYLRHSYSFAHRAVRAHDQRIFFVWTSIPAFWIARMFGTWMHQNFWGHWHSNVTGMMYAGLAAWAGIALLPVKKDDTPVMRVRIYALALTIFIFLLTAFNAPPFKWVHKLPVLNTLFEYYHIAFVAFGVPLLGAIGLERWFDKPRRLRETLWFLPWVLVAAGMAYGIFAFNWSYLRRLGALPFVHVQFIVAAVFAALTLGICVVYCFWRRPRLLILLLTLVLAADLIASSRGLKSTSPRSELFFETKLTNFLLEREQPCRVAVGMTTIPGGLMPTYGIEDWHGYDGIYPERMRTWREQLGTDLWKAMEPACAIDYYLNDVRFPEPLFPRDELNTFHLVATFEGTEVYTNSRAFSRAFLVPEVRVVPDLEEMFETMRDERFDPASVVLVERPPEGELPHATAANLGEAKVTQRSFTHEEVQVDAAEDCALVLSESFYPGWKAFLDGERVDLWPAFYTYRGVLVPAGEHTIQFRYEPLSFYLGLWTSAITLLGSIVAVLWQLRCRASSGAA